MGIIGKKNVPFNVLNYTRLISGSFQICDVGAIQWRKEHVTTFHAKADMVDQHVDSACNVQYFTLMARTLGTSLHARKLASPCVFKNKYTMLHVKTYFLSIAKCIQELYYLFL